MESLVLIRYFLFVFAGLGLLSSLSAYAAAAQGYVHEVRGDVQTVLGSGKSVKTEKNQSLTDNTTITTGANSNVIIKFIDGTVIARSVDIGQTVDPDTGVMVSGRSASAAVRIAALPVIPRGMAESSWRPWLLVVDGLKYKVAHSNPDRSLGVVVLLLEGYK
jgi:hypothetical protein